VLEISPAVNIATGPVQPKFLTHERRDLAVLFIASFFHPVVGCRMFKRGFDLVK